MKYLLFFFKIFIYSSKYLFKLFHFTFTSHAIYVAELIAAATVALVGAVHVGTLLTTWVALTLIQIYTETR